MKIETASFVGPAITVPLIVAEVPKAVTEESVGLADEGVVPVTLLVARMPKNKVVAPSHFQWLKRGKARLPSSKEEVYLSDETEGDCNRFSCCSCRACA